MNIMVACTCWTLNPTRRVQKSRQAGRQLPYVLTRDANVHNTANNLFNNAFNTTFSPYDHYLSHFQCNLWLNNDGVQMVVMSHVMCV